MGRMDKNKLMVVQLTEKVWIYTEISSENHAALRSGFAGYPSNPRWNVIKYHAWKIGRQWREELSQGTMEIRSSDSMLVSIEEKERECKKPNLQTGWLTNHLSLKQILVSS